MHRIGLNLFLFLAVAALIAVPALPAAGVPTVALVSPVGGEAWLSGSTHEIKWTNGPYVTDVTVALCTDGANWELIADQIPALAGQEQSVSWQFPNTESDKCTIRIIFHTSYNGNTTVGNVDSGYFSLGKLAMPKKLGAPANLTATAASDTAIQLDWTNVSGQAQNYAVERYDDSTSSWDPVVSNLAADAQGFLDQNLEPATTYRYRVYCTAPGWNQSVYSNEAAAATLAPPAAPIPNPASNTSPTIMRFQVGSFTCYVNNLACQMDAPPIATEGRILLPIRFVVESLGGDATWDGTTATVTCNGHVIQMWLNTNTASVDGASMPIDSGNPAVVPVVSSNRLMLPLRFVSENIGCSAEWTGAEAVITYPAVP